MTTSSLTLWALGCFATAVAPSGLLAQNMLPNGDFQGGVAGWTPDEPLPPATSFVWDGFEGNPAGSASLESSLNGDADVLVSSTCLPSLGEGTYRVEADILDEGSPGGECFLLFEQHEDTADCTGTLNPQNFFQAPDPGWSHVGEEIFVGGATQALRVQFYLRRNFGTEPSRCHYDNVGLFGPVPSPLEVPTASAVGLAALVAALAIAGLSRRGFVGRRANPGP